MDWTSRRQRATDLTAGDNRTCLCGSIQACSSTHLSRLKSLVCWRSNGAVLRLSSHEPVCRDWRLGSHLAPNSHRSLAPNSGARFGYPATTAPTKQLQSSAGAERICRPELCLPTGILRLMVGVIPSSTLELKALRCFKAAVTRNDRAIICRQNRVGKPEPLNAVGDLPDLLFGMCSSVLLVRLQLRDFSVRDRDTCV